MAYDYDYHKGEEYAAVTHTFDPVVDVSSATAVTATFKREKGQPAADITIAHSAMDLTNGTTGVIAWDFTSDHLATAGTYEGTIKAVISATSTVINAVRMRIKETAL